MAMRRTLRAFHAYQPGDTFLEDTMRDGNRTARDLLLDKGHLLPPDLVDVASRLVEHYDRWLEEYARQRSKPVAERAAFIFAGPQGFPFPPGADKAFGERRDAIWRELFGAQAPPDPALAAGGVGGSPAAQVVRSVPNVGS